MKKLIQKWLGIDEINDVLTRKVGDYLGSEIDKKVEQQEFEDFKTELAKWKKEVIGIKELSLGFWSRLVDFTYKDTPTILDRLSALEDYLKIEYSTETRKGYKKIKK